MSNITSLNVTTQTDPASDDYSGTDVSFTWTPFDIYPEWCPLVVTCNSVSTVTGSTNIACPSTDLTTGSVIFNYDHDDYTNGLKYGNYTFTYDVATENSVGVTELNK